MGCVASTGSPEERVISSKIDKEISKGSKDIKNEVKLLLLGPGESGKSTIVKQMRIIYCSGFSDDELLQNKPTVFSNIITSMSALVRALDQDPQNPFSEDFVRDCELIDSPELSTKAALTEEIALAIKRLWSNELVKKRFENKSDLQIIDSAGYFFDSIDRISAPGYIPEIQDLLFSRVRTTGITEVRFRLGGTPTILVDVGGQRSERRKWINCFDSVTALFFIVSLSEYDQMLREDQEVNRMHESFALFTEISALETFRETSIILFLNKIDLFQEKMKKVPLKNFFGDFNGDTDFDKGKQFFKERFEQRSPQKKLYCHFTCATDTDNIRYVFDDIEHIFITDKISDALIID